MQKTHVFNAVPFKQDGAPHHTPFEVKTVGIFHERPSDKSLLYVLVGFKITSFIPDWFLVVSRVYRVSPTTLVKLISAIHPTVAAIDGDMLHVVTRSDATYYLVVVVILDIYCY